MAQEIMNNWQNLEHAATEQILRAFRVKDPLDSDTKFRVKTASSVLASVSRHDQSEAVRERTALDVGKTLIADRESLIEYIKATNSHLRPALENADVAGRVKLADGRAEAANKRAIEAQAALVNKN